MTFDEASDAILTVFKTAWDANSPAYNDTTIVPCRWENLKTLDFPPVETPWANPTVHFIDTVIKSLGGVGHRRYVTSGLFSCRIYTPEGLGGASLANDLAQIVLETFVGQHAEPAIWFKDYRADKPYKVAANWFVVNVSTLFEAEFAA